MRFEHGAELYRLRGELILKQCRTGSSYSVQKEAAACFQDAIEIARKQQARSLELRAALSLSRLWELENKQQQARRMVEEIYGWFTEGFDTADLKDAKTLLDQMDSAM